MASELSIGFSVPEHGWMKVVVTQGDHKLEEVVSDVPADSLSMLVEAVGSVLDGGLKASVTWFLEPDEVKWCFSCVGERVEFRVTGPEANEIQLSASGTPAEICLPVWRALRRLEADPFWASGSDQKQWSHPFPGRQMQLLTQQIDDLKAANSSARVWR